MSLRDIGSPMAGSTKHPCFTLAAADRFSLISAIPFAAYLRGQGISRCHDLAKFGNMLTGRNAAQSARRMAE
jgi:hypothetical protein